MFASLHAVGVLGTLVVPGIVIAFSHGWPPPRQRRWLYAVCVITLFGIMSGLLLSARGAPVTEWLFPLVAMVPATMFVKSERAFRAVRSALLLATVVLWCTHLCLIFDGYTSDLPLQTRFDRASASAALTHVRDRMQGRFPPELVFPPSPVKDLLPGLEEPEFTPCTYRRLWHTPFTRLYEITRTPAEIWYPGGPVATGSQELTWKPKDWPHAGDVPQT